MTSSEELRFTKINELPGISDIHDDDTFIIENTNATYKLSGSALIQYIKNHNDIRDTYIESNKVGTGNGIAPLDPNKKIDSDYLLFGKTSGSIYDGAEGALLEKQLLNHTGNTDNPHQIDKSKIGLDQVENKSSETIRSEITYKNITNALGYVPGNSGVIYYGECSADASDPNKIVSCPGLELVAGASINIKFAQTNTAPNSTLNINSTGAKPIMCSDTTPVAAYMWHPGEVVHLVFDGTNYFIADGCLATDSYYGVTKLMNSVSSTSTTTAATPASVKQTYDLANSVSALKADKTIVESHITNENNPHSVTKTQVGLGNVPNVSTNNQTPTFTQAATRSNLVSGEKLSTILGKIVKWLTDLKSGAFATVVNNANTTSEGYVADARIIKTLSDKIAAQNQIIEKTNMDFNKTGSGFYVYNNNRTLLSYGDNILNFDVAVWNDGAFSGNTFSAPYSGRYLFHALMNIETSSETRIAIFFKVNGNNVSYVVDEKIQNNKTISADAYFNLSAGSTVQLVCYTDNAMTNLSTGCSFVGSFLKSV